jgi:HD-GYP domain-containing protein (c-di-GMP phosphodiesterase class II)
VDVFDALTSERPYKKAWPVGEAVGEIERGSGRHFDPDVVSAFLRRIPEMTKIQEQFSDTLCAEECVSLPGAVAKTVVREGCQPFIQGYIQRVL